MNLEGLLRKVDRSIHAIETKLWGPPEGRPQVVWPVFLTYGIFVFTSLEGALEVSWGPIWAGALALAYGLGAVALAAFARLWSEGWARRWQGMGLGASRRLRRLPGMAGFGFLMVCVPLAAMSPLILWAHLPKTAIWATLGFGLMCMAISSEQANRGFVNLLQDAQAQALRAKLAPHFIFNALNTLKAQIATDPEAAEATADRLAQLFRQVVTVSDAPVISLKEELAFVEAYLGIERARFGNRVQVSIEVPEDLESALIPPLSLQVLVENAIKHGVAPLEQGGEIRIGAERRDGGMCLWVDDPGAGFSTHRGTGTALETLRRRLEHPEDLEMGVVDGRHRVGFRWGLA